MTDPAPRVTVGLPVYNGEKYLDETILSILLERGVPNFFGEQRFGNRGNTGRLGELLIRGDASEFVAELLGRPQSHETTQIQAARQMVDAGATRIGASAGIRIVQES